MRHIILALMIVLLPLRGWAGDVMAVDMASTVVAVKAEADSAHKVAPHFNSDCHEQMAAQPEPNDMANNDNCETCQACQVCHSVAMSPSSTRISAAFASPQFRATPTAAFTSAAVSLGQKPPIS